MRLRTLIQVTRAIAERTLPPGERSRSGTEYHVDVEPPKEGDSPSSTVVRHYDGDSPIRYQVSSEPTGTFVYHVSKDKKRLSAAPLKQVGGESHQDAVNKFTQDLSDPEYSRELRVQTQRPPRFRRPR